jgi:hypothetical protein
MRSAVVGLVREKENVRKGSGRRREFYVCGWLAWAGCALTF